MRWYVSRGGDTQGPVDEEVLREWAAAGQLSLDMHVRDESGGTWQPIETSPLGALVAQAVNHRDSANDWAATRRAFWIFGALLSMLLGTCYYVIKDSGVGGDPPTETP